MQLGQTIVKIRKEQGLTQEAFAKKFAVTRQTVSNWENEKSYPDLHTLVKISDEFNLSLDILLKGDANMVNDMNKKIRKQHLYRNIIIGLTFIVVGLFSFIFLYDKSLNDTTKDYLSSYVSSVEVIEVYDSSSKELIVKYDDKKTIDHLISTLDIKNWKNTVKIKKDMEPKYTIKLFNDNTKQDIKELTIYGNGEYTVFFSSSPGLKQEYKTNINVSELICK